MKLLRKINNNAAVAQDKRGHEMVVLGRGVGFHPMPYELTDLSVVYRTFYDVDPQYYEMLSSLPEEALMAAADIAEQAEIALQAELNPNLPFTLADHIAFAQEREKQGIRLATPLHYDVQHLYPREYELGLQAMETVRLRTGTALPRAEAVNIALHIVNAELEGSDLSSTLAAVEVLDEVTVLVERELGIALDRESYNYARFAMHIQFLVRRLSSGKVMEQGSGKMLSEVAREEVPAAVIAVLSGPGFAIDIARQKLACVTIACDRPGIAAKLTELLATPYFRPYTTADMISPQIGGSVKNVIAIASGVIEGAAFGDGARAALITRGLNEMGRVSKALGGLPTTMMGMSGLGDLVLTANCSQSRNFSFGYAVGTCGEAQKVIAENTRTVEGLHTAKAVLKLARKLGVEMPICEMVNKVLFENFPLKAAMEELMNRPYKEEGF